MYRDLLPGSERKFAFAGLITRRLESAVEKKKKEKARDVAGTPATWHDKYFNKTKDRREVGLRKAVPDSDNVIANTETDRDLVYLDNRRERNPNSAKKILFLHLCPLPFLLSFCL